jgi:hypothetical protein
VPGAIEKWFAAAKELLDFLPGRDMFLPVKSLPILLTTLVLAFSFTGCATASKKKADAACCGSAGCAPGKSCPADGAKHKGKKAS